MAPEFPDAPDIQQIVGEERGSDRFARMIAVITVLTTLAAATTALLQANASRTDDEAAVVAERLAGEASGVSVRDRATAQLQIERYEQLQRHRRLAAAALQARLFGGGDAAELERREEREQEIAKIVSRNSERLAAEQGVEPVPEEGPLSAAQDPLFPARYLALAEREGRRLNALRDAANEEGDRAESQVAAFGVALTMFAVAVFLFGYSLTPYGRGHRKLFAGVAGGFVGVALVAVIISALDAPDRAPDEAADAYADGLVALRAGDSEQGVDDLSRAVALRPSFAQAFARRADAIVTAATPSLAGATGLLTEEELRAAIADLRRALELGSEEAGVRGALGFELTALGLMTDDDDLIEESLEFTAEAEERLGTEPSPSYNRGLSLLALGRVEEAEGAYGEAIERTLVTGDGEEREAYARELMVAPAFSDLELVLQYRGEELAEEVEATKERIEREVFADAVPPTQFTEPVGEPPEPSEEVADLPFELSASAGGMRIDYESDPLSVIPGFDPEADRMTLQVYTVDPETGARSVIEPASGPVLPGQLLYDEKRGTSYVFRNVLRFSRPNSCMPPGGLEVEVYVNGSLAAEDSIEEVADEEEIEVLLDRSLSVGVCGLGDWQRSERTRPGLVAGWTAPEEDSGAYVLSVAPRPQGKREWSVTDSEAAMEQGLQEFADLFPGRPRPAGKSPFTFMDLFDSASRLYSYPGGQMIAGAGLTPDGSVLVGAVFGLEELIEADDLETGAGAGIYNSISELD